MSERGGAWSCGRGARLLVTATAMAMLPLFATPGVASAKHADQIVAEIADGRIQSAFNGSYLKSARAMSSVKTVEEGGLLPNRNVKLTVYSESMSREIPLEVILPKDPGVAAPAFYLLNGAGGGEDSATWSARTDIQKFFADENVNVITPVEGMFSYYTDWDEPVAELHGENKWTTFLTQELPSIIDQALETNGKNAIAGLSMAGSSVLSLAQWASDRGVDGGHLYSAVASYSGCAQTSTFPGSEYVRVVTGMRGGIDVTKMWGPVGGQGWRDNDAELNAEKLRGIPYIYVANGSGLPGHHDTLANPELQGSSLALANQAAVGGAIEVATNLCSHSLKSTMQRLEIPAEFNLKPTGTHSWGYWQDDLHISWPGIKAQLATPAA